MRRRICIAGAAISVGSLAVGTAAALAAAKPVAKVTCKTVQVIAVAQGDTDVIPPVPNGTEYGSATCGKLLGSGLETDTFHVPDSGDTLAKYSLYFPTGTIHGKYDLVPQAGDFNPNNLLETDYLGTLTITGGTGTLQGAKGTGTMSCKTLDGIHLKCTDKLKLTKL